MKSFLWVIFFLGFFHVIPAHSVDLVGEIEQPIERAYFPVGFDSDDSAQFMVIGKFKSACFQMGTIFTSVDRAKKRIEVQLTGYEYKGDCLQTEVSFHQVVPLGVIGVAGKFQVIDRVSKAWLGSIDFAKAGEGGSGTDQFTYAPLLDAYLVDRPTSGKRFLVLRGVFHDSCLAIKDVEVQLHGDVLVVLPRIHRPNGNNCRSGDFPFDKAVYVKDNLPEEFLLHVRSMGGQAINKMVYLKKQENQRVPGR